MGKKKYKHSKNEENDSCEFIHSKPKFVLSENKCKVTFNNPTQRQVRQIHVDGCLIKDETREKCDYLLVIDDVNMCLFIELKGAKIDKAISQLKSTLISLKDKYNCSAITCLVVSTRNPLNSTQRQKYAKDLKKQFGAKLKLKNIHHEINLDKEFPL